MQRPPGHPTDRGWTEQRKRQPLPRRLTTKVINPRGGKLVKQEWMHRVLLG
jgi:hypothetical protein